MGDIEVVIKIPEETYQKIKEVNMILGRGRSSKRLDCILFDTVNTGTLLPEGHGRLKDIDKIETLLDLDKADNKIAKALKNIMESVPTIIEANKEKLKEEENVN